MREIFVFGSNKAGRHGKGAAWDAAQYYGAEWGVGDGLTGDAYAIPTKDEKLRSLSLDEIHFNISRFIGFARGHPKLRFIFTPVGTGLAGYTVKEIMRGMNMKTIPDNVLFTASWFK